MSTVPAAKAELLSLLTARLPSVQVTWGPATIDSGQDPESISFDETRLTSRPALEGRRDRETYLLSLLVRVLQEGDDERTTEERCWVLVAEVKNTVRDNPSFGGLLDADVSEVDQNNISRPEAWVSEALVRIRCEALV